jgi:hypothetical protein
MRQNEPDRGQRIVFAFSYWRLDEFLPLTCSESLAKHAESLPEQEAFTEFVSTPIRNLIAAIRTLKVLFLLVLVVAHWYKLSSMPNESKRQLRAYAFFELL